MSSYCIVIVSLCLSISSSSTLFAAATLPPPRPDPQTVVRQFQRRVKEYSIDTRRRRKLFVYQEKEPCGTGNPIDDCWRCNPNWPSNPQMLSGCGIGFGCQALGGKGGRFYIVKDPSDSDPVNPAPGTLRYGVTRDQPLWILFQGDMVVQLKYELLINSFKTIDGRGHNVEITGKGCIIIESVHNVIIHNIHIHHCKPSDNAKIRRSPKEVVGRGPSDGDGISVHGSFNIWIDHCTLSDCTDGLIDVTFGSTAVTISNSYFSNHDKVMLLGHNDDFIQDAGMQVTVAYNHFGEKLMEGMTQCRHGYFHVVNNDYKAWGMYAIGGSANPTINSQGNRYFASEKEVTMRIDAKESEWRRWNWRSEGDMLVNGAVFVSSGDPSSAAYAKVTSVVPFSTTIIGRVTGSSGVLSLPSTTFSPGDHSGWFNVTFTPGDDWTSSHHQGSNQSPIIFTIAVALSLLYSINQEKINFCFYILEKYYITALCFYIRTLLYDFFPDIYEENRTSKINRDKIEASSQNQATQAWDIQ